MTRFRDDAPPQGPLASTSTPRGPLRRRAHRLSIERDTPGLLSLERDVVTRTRATAQALPPTLSTSDLKTTDAFAAAFVLLLRQSLPRGCMRHLLLCATPSWCVLFSELRFLALRFLLRLGGNGGSTFPFIVCLCSSGLGRLG